LSTLQRGTFVKINNIKTKDSYGLVLRYMPNTSGAGYKKVEVYYERRLVVFPEIYLEEIG
tara:strand:- start:9380 stop:9559 length:180 start_codon:yes stop_codon:yes gene_type:complete